jgi:plastocyanin
MRSIPRALLVLLFGVAPSLVAAPAYAGGGCHEGVTRGTGTAIQIIDACFTPTILHVKRGQTVTWVNTDPVVHNITANGWGHYDDLKPTERFTALFDEAGLYPFACTYHPGMSGVIVVGTGSGPGNGTTVAVADPAARDTTAPLASLDAPAHPRGWVAPAAIGLVLGILGGLGLAAARRRRMVA